MPEVALGWNEISLFAAAVAVSGVASGLLAGIFGIGGGAVLVPVFYQVFGLLDVPDSVRMHLSVGSSITTIVPTSIRSFLAHRARGAVDAEILKSFLVPVPAGVVLAAIVAASISSVGLRSIFAIFAFIVAMRLMFNRETWRLGSVIPGNPWRAMIGIFIGFFSTLMGIGGGVLNNTMMTLYGRPIHQAVGTSAGVGVLIAIPGTIGYLLAGWGHPDLPIASTGFINWIAVGIIIPIALVVTPWGVAIAHRLRQRHLEIAFGLFCLLVSIRFFASLAD